MKIVEGLLYTNDHDWVKVEGDKAYIGVTDYAQHQLGDIVFIELPEEGDEFSKEDSFGVIESVKAATDSFIPVSGTVVEVNEDVVDNPALVNEDPYAAWLIAVELNDKSELEDLLSPEDYEKICDKEA